MITGSVCQTFYGRGVNGGSSSGEWLSARTRSSLWSLTASNCEELAGFPYNNNYVFKNKDFAYGRQLQAIKY